MPRIIDEPVTPVRERLICDCGFEMASDGAMNPTDPPKYRHSCKNCGTSGTFDAVYPRVAFKT